MRSQEKSLRAIRAIIYKKGVVRLEELLSVLEVDSRVNVFRRIRLLDYFSSYTHGGRYYTLSSTAQFNSDGLWFYEDIGFSQYKTLKNTVLNLVCNAEVGRTQRELKNQLRVEVQRSLSDLIYEKKIKRKPIDGLYVYLDPDRKRSAEQIKLYQKRELLGPIEIENFSEWMIIEVLTEAIRVSRMGVSVAKVASNLISRGVEITQAQVEEIFKRLGVKKTPV